MLAYQGQPACFGKTSQNLPEHSQPQGQLVPADLENSDLENIKYENYSIKVLISFTRAEQTAELHVGKLLSFTVQTL